jgi:ATP-dependent DNA helicase RecG
LTVQFLGPDPLEKQISDVLESLARGVPVETASVDLKEEAGRRRPNGEIVPGGAKSERAAQALAPEVACMANTPGGGALVLGAADDGRLIGTQIDADWLRHRLYELSDRKTTVDVREMIVNSQRVLVLRVIDSLTPVTYKGRLTWRVGKQCVEVDVSTWMSGRLYRLGQDATAAATGYTVHDVRPVALQRARDYLRESGEAQSLELSLATDVGLLRRLNAITGDGVLTYAGALLFVGRGEPALDYIRRARSGGDSSVRLRQAGISVLEELFEVERAIAVANPVVQRSGGLVQGQIKELPESAIREAIVNGIAHRDWQSPSQTVIEHVGASLVVTSPGGFVGGVTSSNIITHPSQPRNRSLAEMLAALRIAEREGIGVDRMVRELVRFGFKSPSIRETEGPHVRASLVGGVPDRVWIAFLAAFDPPDLASDLDVLLLLARLAQRGWIDATSAAPDLQRDEAETRAAIDRLATATVDDSLVIQRVDGVPPSDPPRWRFGTKARALLADRLDRVFSVSARQTVAEEWAVARGRISSTEFADLVGIAQNNARETLKQLEDDGILAPSRENRMGRGFYYVPVHGKVDIASHRLRR